MGRDNDRPGNQTGFNPTIQDNFVKKGERTEAEKAAERAEAMKDWKTDDTGAGIDPAADDPDRD